VNGKKTKALWLKYSEQLDWTMQWGWEWIPHHTIFNYLGCLLGLGVTQSSRDDWLVAKVRDKLGKWSRNHLSTAGRLVILNHMIGGLLNFYLGIWSLSK